MIEERKRRWEREGERGKERGEWGREGRVCNQ